ncbi:MAG TPA: pyridoxamine 5'-phosphate oxidase family protein [Methylomirabilota bacterium]|jgi:nitroimidazol reductase NimA-like FMN-containing flavoprotein (pyridoxamine 5'-phosphate oxidase superfamily)
MRLRRAHADFLALQRVAQVATADARGIPHVVPVCLVVEAGRLYFASGKTGRKIENLRANPQVAVSADDYSEAWDRLRGVVVQGTARVHARNPTFRRIRRRLYAKYPQYPAQAALGDGDSVVVEVTPRRVYAWGFD